MRPQRILALALLLALLAASLAHAQGPRPQSVTPYSKYTISGQTELGSVDVGYRAYMLLPQKLRDRTANGGPVLRFGPIGSCNFNLSIAAKVVPRTGDENAGERAARLYRGASSQFVYSTGTRASAAWRVIRVKGSANVRGIYVLPVNLRTSFAFDTPITPAWLEVRATANDHSEECHSGGPRYIGATLAEAFGAASATAFGTNLKRLPLPPKPS